MLRRPIPIVPDLLRRSITGKSRLAFQREEEAFFLRVFQDKCGPRVWPEDCIFYINSYEPWNGSVNCLKLEECEVGKRVCKARCHVLTGYENPWLFVNNHWEVTLYTPITSERDLRIFLGRHTYWQKTFRSQATLFSVFRALFVAEADEEPVAPEALSSWLDIMTQVPWMRALLTKGTSARPPWTPEASSS